MGMFDWVEYKTKCRYCGADVDGFQTKSGPCMLQTIPPGQAGYFYASCKKCDAWCDVEVVVKDYQLVEEWREPRGTQKNLCELPPKKEAQE